MESTKKIVMQSKQRNESVRFNLFVQMLVIQCAMKIEQIMSELFKFWCLNGNQ